MTVSNRSSFLDAHLVRYQDLEACTTAFIDTRTPGSKQKENFTIIGPGVAENPDQHVHITRAHGFNIGGARQPPNCVNSQHSHLTAEVFVVHSGTWAFTSGEFGTDGRVILRPGDTISLPTNCFRGFENIGNDEGFLFAVLGGDDPGRVTWAPYVFAQAQEHGLVLLENGALVDTAAGENLPQDIEPMPPTSQEMVDAMQILRDSDLESCVVRHRDIVKTPCLTQFTQALDELAALEPQSFDNTNQIMEHHILGTVSGTKKPTPLNWSHGFQIHHLSLPGGSKSPAYQVTHEEVILLQSGALHIDIEDHHIELGAGDVFTAPIAKTRQISNPDSATCEAYVVYGCDTLQRKIVGEND